MNGTDILILIDGVAVGSQRDCSFEETNDKIDMSSKDGRARRVDAGRYGATLSLDALYVPSDAAYQALKTAMRAGTKVTVNRSELGGVTESAQAIVTSLSGEAPDQDAATISIDLTIDGEWTEGS